jgi:HlyD family secretion protein
VTPRTQALALLSLLAACQPTEAPPDAAQVPWRSEQVRQRDIVVAVESAGVIEPITVVDVKSKASGEILERPVQNGDLVEAGTLMVKVDERVPKNTLAQAESALDVARARLENAQSQLTRMTKLYATAAVPEADREKTELDVANARAEVVRSEVAVENARIAMDDTIVRAPITGTIIQLSVERGQVISSPTSDVGGGTLLLRMADLSEVQVRALVDETDIGKVTAGAQASVTVAAYPNRKFSGRVEKIEPQATSQQNVTMFPVLVRLTNEEALLKPGMNAEITLGIAERRGVLAVPAAALRTTDDVDAAASVLGLDLEAVQQQLAAMPMPAAPGAPATAGAGSAAPAGSGEAPPIPQERIRELFTKMRSGETLSDEERAQMAEVRAWRERNGGGPGGPGGGRGGAGGGGGAFAAGPGGGSGSGGGMRGPGMGGPGMGGPGMGGPGMGGPGMGGPGMGGPGMGFGMGRGPGGGGPGGDGNNEPADPFAQARRRSALDAQMGGDFIVFVREQGKVGPRRVRAGITDLDYTEIVAGIEAGAEVLILPSEALVRAQEGFKERVTRMTGGLPFGS